LARKQSIVGHICGVILVFCAYFLNKPCEFVEVGKLFHQKMQIIRKYISNGNKIFRKHIHAVGTFYTKSLAVNASEYKKLFLSIFWQTC